MKPLYEEYQAHGGTIIKPYYWLSFSLDCTNCPYHIRTGEEARVSYTEFHQIFGYPHGPVYPQPKHLIFYELKNSSGSLVQKGHATNCTGSPTHPESMLFEIHGYLDSVISSNSTIKHIILYSNHTPCNEANNCCISKMYHFLMLYPNLTLSVYFSQFYHTGNEFPAAPWNREALRSLASLWPQVTLSPISGGIWHSLLNTFVNGISGSAVFQPILAGRAMADRYNAYEINCITGVKPHFTEVIPHASESQNVKFQATLQNSPFNNVFQRTSAQQVPILIPDLKIPVIFVLVPYRDLPPMPVSENPHKPTNVVRHLNVPQPSFCEANELSKLPMGRPVEMEEMTACTASSKEADKNKAELLSKHM
ncbi:PREDICTED: putative C-_U-editing enzyme APOBEC-4 [Dipodomys ordii]|uniref:C->U-editing enzyme APOBEC-4 n=1 Tax=Dipodomys ordii TaxID=10020 RepID=A0A1S3F4D7_DIPOR|nr:PREDICTED: putative C->U-editing enzyme APOBEC-4 [Dipodomys ordii]